MHNQNLGTMQPEGMQESMPVKNLDFGTALYFLKQGKKIQREGWNGKGQFWSLL